MTDPTPDQLRAWEAVAEDEEREATALEQLGALPCAGCGHPWLRHYRAAHPGDPGCRECEPCGGWSESEDARPVSSSLMPSWDDLEAAGVEVGDDWTQPHALGHVSRSCVDGDVPGEDCRCPVSSSGSSSVPVTGSAACRECAACGAPAGCYCRGLDGMGARVHRERSAVGLPAGGFGFGGFPGLEVASVAGLSRSLDAAGGSKDH